MTIGQTGKYLRGARRPDAHNRWKLYKLFGIEPPLWDEDPREEEAA